MSETDKKPGGQEGNQNANKPTTQKATKRVVFRVTPEEFKSVKKPNQLAKKSFLKAIQVNLASD